MNSLNKPYICDFCGVVKLSGNEQDTHIIHYGKSGTLVFLICKDLEQCEKIRYEYNNVMSSDVYHIINEFKTKFKLEALINQK